MAQARTQVQTVYIDASSIASVNDATLPYAGQLGLTYSSNGKTYQLVQFKSTTTTIAAGTAVMWTDPANFVVSAKVADSVRNMPAGMALGTVTAGNYGWIQVGGPVTTLISTGSITAGDVVIMSSTDGTVAGIAAGTAPTYLPLGPCTVTAASNVVGCLLQLQNL